MELQMPGGWSWLQPALIYTRCRPVDKIPTNNYNILSGNLVKFSEDSFGVIFLQINSFSIYKRLEEPI